MLQFYGARRNILKAGICAHPDIVCFHGIMHGAFFASKLRLVGEWEEQPRIGIIKPLDVCRVQILC